MATDAPVVPPSSALARPRRARGRALAWLLVLVLLALGGWKLRAWWQANVTPPPAAQSKAAMADEDLATTVAGLRREQHALAQRMSDATSANQLLRDEVLGVGERAALLEQSVARIANPSAQGDRALRLDEAELLLTIGQQQIELASDSASALHAYALADAALAGSTDPAALNLRQSLAQETAALRALPPDPRALVAGGLDAFEATLDAQPAALAIGSHPAPASLFDRVVGSMVDVRRAQAQELLDPAAREAGVAALRLELTIARLALERRDGAAFRAALARIQRWLPRLYAPSVVARQKAQLDGLATLPLRVDLPTLGGTLAELHRLRDAQPAPAPATTETPAAPAPSPTTDRP